MIFFNRYFDKNRLKALVLWSLTKSGEKTTIDLVEKLKDLGFHSATQAGLSLSIDDLKIPPNKPELILEAETIVQSSQKNYKIGNVTIIEKFQQMIDVWHRTSEILKDNVIQNFRATDILNPVYMMAFSGARGNISQVRQLVGMRGLMADPQGQILDFPIRSNFREGLTLTEYVISCYGARKGLVDTALRTANSGYLTRRLVDVAQHIIVRQLDCGTNTGIIVTDMQDGKKVILSVSKRIIGRVLAESIEPIAFKNQDISPSLAVKIGKLKKEVLVRSPLTCEAKNSVCQLCYGWSLAHGNLVSLGEAVGILAAQSIGEPGTQLTMRTFHTGGVFSGDIMQEIRSPITGHVSFSSPLQGSLIRTLHGKIAFLTKMEGEFSLFENKKETISDKVVIQNHQTSKLKYQIPTSSILFVRQFEKVEEKQLVAEFSSFVTTNNQGIQAKYNLNSEKEGQIYFENVLLVVKGGKEGNLIKTALKFGSIWILAGKLYESPIRSTLFTTLGDLIDTNSILNESILAIPYSGFLESIQLKKRKEIFFSTKLQLQPKSLVLQKNKISFLNQLIIGKKNLSISSRKINFKSSYRSKNEINLKQPFTTVSLKNINYKKFGYFISLSSLPKINLFFPNKLFHEKLKFNQLYLQIFFNDVIKKNGYFFYESNPYQRGQFFLIPQNCYKIENSSENVQNFKIKIFKKLYLRKKINILYKVNLQGNKKPITSNPNECLFVEISLIGKDKDKLKNNNLKKFNKKILLYKVNPYQKIYSPLKKYRIKTIIKVNNSKKCQLPVNRNSQILNYQSFNKTNFRRNLNVKPMQIQLKVETGWISIPKKLPRNLILNTYFIEPGKEKNFFNTDQQFSVLKKIDLRENLYFLAKNNPFPNIRYITNKFFRFNNFDTKNLFSKKIEKNNFKQTLSRNKIILKNIYLTTRFLEIRKKTKELNDRNIVKKSIMLQSFSKSLSRLNFYKNNSFLFNKQQITRLLPSSQNITLQINQNLIQKRRIPTIIISFKSRKANLLKKLKIEFLFPLTLQFSVIQKINTSTFSISPHLRTEKLLVTKENAIFEQTKLSFNSFYSPDSGEITSKKIDEIGKEKSLLLTKKDQIIFLNDQEDSLIQIGQLLRYGDPIFSNIASQESGQIIEIDKNKIILRKAEPILFSSQGVFHVDNGDLVEKNAPLITLFYQKLKTEDIVQGIPKIEELFEARQTKEGETLQENLHTKLSFFFNYYKQKFTSQEATRKSIKKIQQILVNNVQKVYQSQGVTIADKHIEIIVRQMTTKVKITESGRTGLLRGELIDLEWVEIINLGIEAQNELVQQGSNVEKAEYEPIILGITKAALETESFISASSFQETTRILSRAAIERKTDFLRGLKENVILGHLIPAGTGFRLSFDPQLKTSNTKKKLSWLSYKEILKLFSN